MLKCSICGREISHPLIPKYVGNNPYPVRTGENDRCCDECNNEFVIVFRLALIELDNEQRNHTANLLNNAPYDKLKFIAGELGNIMFSKE